MGLLKLLSKLSSFYQFFDITVAAHQHALDKHHGESGPARPHFEGIALTPFTEVAAIFQIVVLDIGGRQPFLNGFANGVLTHSHHHHTVLGQGGLYLFHYVSVVIGNHPLNGGVDVCLIQEVSRHRSSLVDGGAMSDSDEMTRPLSSKDNALSATRACIGCLGISSSQVHASK